jgi:sporulation protein YlmC with PRC-barrel domain
MGSLSASAVLQLPVRLRGIQLGRPVDVLLEAERWRVVGFVVRCGDESHRFLPLAACQISGGQIAVASALMLLEDVGFYRARGTSFRSLLGGDVQQRGRRVGRLSDVLFADGEVVELELDRGGSAGVVRLPVEGTVVVPSRASAA